jgi:hypothetical protein
MKKILFAIAIIASSATFVSCTADSIADEPTLMNPTADDTGGTGTVPPIKPPPPANPGFGK